MKRSYAFYRDYIPRFMCVGCDAQAMRRRLCVRGLKQHRERRLIRDSICPLQRTKYLIGALQGPHRSRLNPALRPVAALDILISSSESSIGTRGRRARARTSVYLERFRENARFIPDWQQPKPREERESMTLNWGPLIKGLLIPPMKKKRHSPTTSILALSIRVWYEGLPADTSHLYVPVRILDTFTSVTSCVFDLETCKKSRSPHVSRHHPCHPPLRPPRFAEPTATLTTRT